MAHECGCHTHPPSTTRGADTPITQELTVGDVAQRYAGALDVMKDMGINHCCGSHLSLREAAASAGVAIEALLDALNRPAAAKA
jgi:iron-sulfur cluster repair protein YtfE (RIC family)